jgi:maltose alpha-D-glucosyltransferase/alpha-amylase
MLHGDRRRLELAYSLMMTLPGTPMLRYGDEIGMGDDLRLPERNCARTPMQWSTELNGGFTAHPKPILPVITEGPYGFRRLNVAMERRDPNSFLNWMERIIRMRKEIPEIGWGDFSVLPLRMPNALAMAYEWRNNCVLFLHNLISEPQEVRFRLPAKYRSDKNLLVNLLSGDNSEADERERHCVVLEPYGYRWYRVGGLDYLLRRSDV